MAASGSEPDETLTDDVDAFVENVKSQTYVEGWDWDHRTDAMIVWGDESWARDMEDLFSRIDDAFFAGEFATAAAEYPKLLATFALPDETGEGYFPGEGDPVSMVGINLKETITRYLRSLLGNDGHWEIKAFITALNDMAQQFYQPISLKAILEASSQPFTDTEAFLRQLEPILIEKAQHPVGYRNAPDWQQLLRDAVLMRGGTDALGNLAREHGKATPETYYEWIMALRREERDDEALQATRDAIAVSVIPNAKGILANALAMLLDERSEEEEALQAKQLAWRTYPSLYNLKVYLACGHPAVSEMLSRIEAEYPLVRNGEIDFSHLDYSKHSMRILFFALAGDFDHIAMETHTITGVGWSASDHIGYSAYTLLLLALLDPPALPPAGSQLAALLSTLEGRASSHGLNTIMPTGGDLGVDIPALLIARLTGMPSRKEGQSVYLDATRQIAYRRVEGIVGGQHRSAYDRAALIAVALAEAVKLSGHPGEAATIPRELVARFPRHSAFRGELQTAWRQSPLFRGTSW